jgi:N-acetylneuraminate synthase
MMSKPWIIAEAGVNHTGSVAMACQLIDAAVTAGADAVKFQTFKTEGVVTRAAEQAAYQTRNTGVSESQFEMIKRLELSYDDFAGLADYCQQVGIQFMSTAFDLDSLAFLNQLGLETLKIPSGEVTNGSLLLAYAQTGCKIILSTGMATLAEVEAALAVLAYGLVHPNGTTPDQETYLSAVGQQALKEHVILLHCTTEYPAPANEVNLRAMDTMQQAFGLPVGYSDHTEGIVVPAVAAAMGAVVIEKHFTLDKTLEGPDHKASLEPDELSAMVQAIHTASQIMGDGYKRPTPSEMPNMNIARRSLVANMPITAGEVFRADNLTAKRPGGGVNPMEYWRILGTTATRDYCADESIDP